MKNIKSLKAFVKKLPKENEPYFQILETENTVSMRSGLVNLTKEKSVGEHTTSGYEEMLIIINGKGEAQINSDKKFQLEKGQIAYIPPNTVHNVINTGDEILQYIYVVAKAD
jgi:quercetin dioxygenase-like cupin family protein